MYNKINNNNQEADCMSSTSVTIWTTNKFH